MPNLATKPNLRIKTLKHVHVEVENKPIGEGEGKGNLSSCVIFLQIGDRLVGNLS